MKAVAERDERLWWLAIGPAIWLLHFLLSYATASVWCAKIAAQGGSLAGARMAIGTYTAVALIGIVATGWRGYRRHRFVERASPHAGDTPGDRTSAGAVPGDGTIAGDPPVDRTSAGAVPGDRAIGGDASKHRTHAGDTPEDRTRQLGYATMLLCALSAVAAVFVALSAFFNASCR